MFNSFVTPRYCCTSCNVYILNDELVFLQGNEFRVLSEEEVQERKKMEKQKQEEKQSKLNKRKEKKKEQQGRD